MQSIALSRLLHDTARLLNHSRRLQQLKGESFNIFRVLGLESAENRTHSAFLAELLKPKGTHLMGDVFLKLFFQTLGLPINTGIYTVAAEKPIGPRNDVLKTGGRIDLVITDASGNTVSIENKVYANDQYTQIERYCNYNKGKNRVYYLTLAGEDPSKESKGNLEVNKDFYLLSYSQDILNWLTACHKEAITQPILRESIRQYILLIKQLTGQMEDTEQKELYDLMLRHFAEAQYIARNAFKARRALGSVIQATVVKKLEDILNSEEFEVCKGTDALNETSKFAQIWIKLKAFPESDFIFGLESFTGTGHEDGAMFVGIFTEERNCNLFGALPGNQTSFGGSWVNVYKLQEFEGIKINLNDPETVTPLHNDPAFKERFCQHLAIETQNYIQYQLPGLLTFLKTPHG